MRKLIYNVLMFVGAVTMFFGADNAKANVPEKAIDKPTTSNFNNDGLFYFADIIANQENSDFVAYHYSHRSHSSHSSHSSHRSHYSSRY